MLSIANESNRFDVFNEIYQFTLEQPTKWIEWPHQSENGIFRIDWLSNQIEEVNQMKSNGKNDAFHAKWKTERLYVHQWLNKNLPIKSIAKNLDSLGMAYLRAISIVLKTVCSGNGSAMIWCHFPSHGIHFVFIVHIGQILVVTLFDFNKSWAEWSEKSAHIHAELNLFLDGFRKETSTTTTKI